MHQQPVSTLQKQDKQPRLSYKFQRLRERIRQALASGELAGKLPGERELARRFGVNPKTLSKALTDLAAEGLLDRSIGRGTYTRGQSDEHTSRNEKWLVLCDPGATESPLVNEVRALRPGIQVTTESLSHRPSFINQFNVVLDLAAHTPERFCRDLLVRGITVVRVGNQPQAINMHAVLIDRAHAVHQLTRDLLLAGHRRILLLTDSLDEATVRAARRTVERYQPQAVVTAATPDQAELLGDASYTAILCDGESAARHLEDAGDARAQRKDRSVAVIGLCDGEPTWSGIYVRPDELARTACELAHEAQRPMVLYLTGRYIEANTIHAVPASQPLAMSA